MMVRDWFRSVPQNRRSSRRCLQVAAQVASLEPRLLLTANMTDQEQLLLELINRARANPTAEANRFSVGLNDGLPAGTITTTAKQPLAPHQILINIAQAHSQDMLFQDYFDHLIPGTQIGPGDRAVAAGYPAPASAVGENIAWGGSTGAIDNNAQVYARHEALFKSPGHRQNMLNPPYEEVGTGIRYGQFTQGGTTYNAAMVTENFGVRSIDPYITGVVYTDTNANDFYDIGESIRTGTITATNVNTGATFTDTIGSSGAYGVIVPAGVYSVRASYTVNGAATSSTQLVTVNTDNVKVDFDTTTPGTLNLTASSIVTSINELGAVTTTTVTVTRNGSTSAALTVNLTSSDTTEATVPASVVIPAGQTAASFVVTAVNDQVIDGSQVSRITTAAAGYGSGTISITVTDRTTPQLPSAEQVVATSRPTFSWSAIANAATYEIWVNNVTTSESRVISVSGITQASYTAQSDLGIGTYNVWVRGVTAGGLQSIWSPAAVWKLRPTTTVNNPNRTETSPSFTIAWNPIPGASSYDVWVDRLTSQTTQYLRNTNVIGTSLAVSNFAIGRYGIWVRGRNLRGDFVNWSPQAIITVNTPVSGLAVTAASLNGGATLNWPAVVGATTYDVWIDNLTTGTAQFVRNTSVATNSLSLPTLTAGSYRSWVRARDVNGLTYNWSLPFSFEFQQAPRLVAPSANPGVARPVFLWTSVSGATSYELVIADSQLTPVITESSLTGTTYTPAAALTAGSYRAWITAIDGNGNRSAQSALISFTIASVDPLNDPDTGAEANDQELLFASLEILERAELGVSRENVPAAKDMPIAVHVVVDQQVVPSPADERDQDGDFKQSGSIDDLQFIDRDAADAGILTAAFIDYWSGASEMSEA